MERIFGAAWIYIGHESQVKKPGDYFATQIGRQPVVMVRDDDGKVRVIHNQCAHRGAMVVATEKGNAPTNSPAAITAGPTISTAGSRRVPLNHGYPQRLRRQESEDRDACGAAGEELSRLRVRERSGRRAEPGGMARPHDDLARRHDRPRARTARSRSRAACSSTPTTATGSSISRTCATPRIRSFAHRSSIEAAQQQSDDGAFRRLGRDRDPPDAPERRALQLLGNRRSASGPIRTATATSATTTTTPSSSPR